MNQMKHKIQFFTQNRARQRENKFSDRSIKKKLEIMTDQPTDKQTGSPTDRRAHMEVSLPITYEQYRTDS